MGLFGLLLRQVSLTCCASCFFACLASVVGLACSIWPGPILCPRCECINLGPAPLGDADACAVGGRFSTQELLTKGFTVQSQFLPKESVDLLLRIWETIPYDSVTNPGANGGFQNNGRKELGNTGTEIMTKVPGLFEKMQALVKEVERTSDIRILTPDGFFEVGQNFLTTDSRQAEPLMEPWHQDFEASLFHQTVHHVLAFYVMLDKPDPHQAGLQVVPRDLLLARSPELQGLLDRPADSATGGGCNFKEHVAATGRKKTVVTDLFTDRQVLLNYTLDVLACTPELRPGDLLVYHGPAIHRTQPHKSWRTSLNMWVHPRQPKSVGKLLQGGFIKYFYMSQNMQRHLADFRSDLEHFRADMGLRLGWRLRKVLRPVRERLDGLFVGGFGAWPSMGKPC